MKRGPHNRGSNPQESMLLIGEGDLIDEIEENSRMSVTKVAAGKFKVTVGGDLDDYYTRQELEELRDKVL